MIMDKDKKAALERKGWKVGTTSDFLELTPEEVEYIELKFKLSEFLREYRKEKNLTQVALAKMLHSSQSRIVKMEHGDPSVSLDLIIRSLLAMGKSKQELASVISS